MQRWIFLEDLVQSAGDLVFVSTRFWLDGESDGGFRVFDLWIDDWLRLVSQCVAGLRVFQFDDGDDVAGRSLLDLVESLARDDVQCAETFSGVTSRVLHGRIGC